MSAPAFGSKGTEDHSQTGTITPAYPGTVNAGDILFLMVMNYQGGVTIGSIGSVAGWTLLESGNFKDSSPVTVGNAALFYKIATGSEAGTVSVTRTGDTGGTTEFAGQIYSFSGANAIESHNMNSTADGSSPIDFDAVTVGGNERTLVALYAGLDSLPGGVPAGYTNKAQDTISTGAFDYTLDCHDKENVSSDGAVTGTGGTLNGYVTFHLSLFTPAGRSFIVN